MSGRRERGIQPDNDNYKYNSNAGNFGNSGSGPNMSPGGGMNMNNLGQMLNNMDFNQILGQLSQMMGGGPQMAPPQGGPQGGFQGPRPMPRDPRVQLLQAMKPFLSKRRGMIVDNIGNLYNIVRIVRGFRR